jgi:hypothetical protein
MGTKQSKSDLPQRALDLLILALNLRITAAGAE